VPDANQWKKNARSNRAIEILLEHDTAGDPITGIRWTHKTPAGIADLLRQLDIEISANTVARLLRDMDFSLRVNRKAIATDSSPDRAQQFRYISSLRTRFERQGFPSSVSIPKNENWSATSKTMASSGTGRPCASMITISVPMPSASRSLRYL